ncbi:DUF4817 domain-containing protein [Trichonephila clavipes]|nr:DUF4817 domain-containing protein [Trichonephila clavipes]
MQQHLSESTGLKKQRHGLMSECALKDMMVKFEKTGQLGVIPGGGRKRVNTTVVENIATAVMEASSESLSLHGTVSVPKVSRTLNMSYSTVRHMRKILNFYQYLRDSYSPATSLPTRNHIHARWAPPHIASSVQQLLRQALIDARESFRSFPTAWNPRSPDLTPCDL